MSNEVLDKIQQVKLEKDTKIIPENIKLNETIFGIEGQLEGDVGLGTTLLSLENQVHVLSTAINGKAGISTDATAEASDILIGQTAYVNGQKITGIMPNNGTLNYSPSVGVQNIPSGYTTGGIISGVTSSIDPNITAENIKNGVNILGVVGNLSSGIDTSDADATVEDLAEGVTAYVNGVKLTGMANTGAMNIADYIYITDYDTNTISVSGKTSSSDVSHLIYPNSSQITMQVSKDDMATYANLTPEILKQGETVLGVVGTFEGGGTTLNNQDKVVSPTLTVQNITADSGYTGLNQVTINAVTSSIDPNITAANIKKGVTILNVAGTFVGSGGSNASIKVFDSISNMNADASPVNNGLAVVYDERDGNLTSTDTFQSIIFPQSVTLPNAIPSGSSISCSFQPTDYESMVMMDVSLDDTSFMLSYNDSENGINFSVSYMCYDMDGQHYTRDNLPSSTGSIVVSGDTVDFGQEFKSSYGWNDAIGYFMSVGIQEFNGLFKYTNNSYGLAPSQLTTKKDYVYNSIFFGVDGVEEGTLQTCNNLTLNDVKIKSEIYGSISQLTLNNNITSMYNAMQYDYNLTYLPEIDTRNIVNMYGAFRGCRNLVGIPNFDTVNVTDMAYMLAECRNLKEVPQFNTVNITNIQGMFYECNNLSNASIQNIINMCLNSNITNISVMNFSNRNQYSPLYFTQYDNSYYQNRLTDLTNAGWSY